MLSQIWVSLLLLHTLYSAIHFTKHYYWHQTTSNYFEHIELCGLEDNHGLDQHQSTVDGVGLFAQLRFEPGECLFVVAQTKPSHSSQKKTWPLGNWTSSLEVPDMSQLGSLVNHNWTANLRMVPVSSVACQDPHFKGNHPNVVSVCLGAVVQSSVNPGDELYFNYMDAPWYIRAPMPWW